MQKKLTFSIGRSWSLILLLILLLPTRSNAQVIIQAQPFVSGSGSALGPILLTDGLIATPSLAFASEPGMGVYKLATGNIGITYGGGGLYAAFMGSSGISLVNNRGYNWSSGTTDPSATIDTQLTRSRVGYVQATVGYALGGNGTVGCPALYFVTDGCTTGTGFFLAGTGIIDVSNLGTAYTRFLSVGGITGTLIASSSTLSWGSSGVTSPDLFLARDGVGILALKNGANVQAIRVYGNTTGSKYVTLSHDGTNPIITSGSGTLQLAATGLSFINNADLNITAGSRFLWNAGPLLQSDTSTTIRVTNNGASGGGTLDLSGANTWYLRNIANNADGTFKTGTLNATTAYQINGVAGVGFAMTHATPADQTGNATATFKMNGLGAAAAPCIITPTSSGRVNFKITGVMNQTTTADGVTIKLAEGTGTPPANAAAASGTVISATQTWTALTGMLAVPFAIESIATGLVANTAVWYDLQIADVTGGTASVKTIDCVAHEN